MSFGLRDLAQVAITAEDKTGAAFDSLKRNVADVRGAFGSLQGMLAGFGVGLTTGAFSAIIKGSIEATGALNDLKDSTALTVQTLSGLQNSARIFGADFSMVTNTAQKFARSVAEAAGGNIEYLRSFEALGISMQRLRDGKFDDLFTEFAGKIANAENKTYAVAYAMQLAGRNAANALPFFKDISEAGLAHATVSAEQAAAADKLGDEIGRLKNEFALWAESLGTKVVPVMLEWIEKTNQATQATGGLLSGLNALAQLPQFGDNAVEQIRKIDAELAKVRERQGFYSGWAAQPLLGMRESGLLQARAVAEAQLKARGYGQYVGDTGLPTPGGGVLPPPPATPGPKDTAGPQLIAQLNNQLGELNGQSSVVEQTIRKLTDGTHKYTLEVQASALAIAVEIDQIKERKAAFDDYARSIERADAAQAAADKVLADFNKKQSETLQNLEFETRLLGLNDVQREQAIALRKLENDYLQASIRLVGEEADAYARRMETTKQIYEQQRAAISAAVFDNVVAEKAKDAHQKLVDDIKHQNEQITQSLTDALLRGFENGYGFAQNFRETLKNMFSTLILRPIIQPIAQGAASVVGGVLGGFGIPGYANAGGIGGGIGQSLFSNGLSSAFSGFGSSLFGGAGAYASALGLSSSAAGSQAALLAAQTGEFGLAGLAGTASSAGAAGASALLSALPYVGLALGGLALTGAFGSKGGPATGTGVDVSGLAGMSGVLNSTWYGNSANSNQSFRWQTHDHGAIPALNEVITGIYKEISSVGEALGLDTSKLSGAQVPFGFHVLGNSPTGGPSPQEAAAALAASAGQISDALALQLMPNLRDFAQANETATETLLRLVTVQEQLRSAEEQQINQLSNAVRGLPGALGITGLEGARNALATSEYVSPLSRLTSARSLLEQTYQSALGGDLTAVNAFPQVLQQALTIGRDVGASGPAFQELFLQGNKQLNDLLARQQSVQQELLQSVPVAVMEASKDQIGEFRKGFMAMVDKLESVEAELRRIRQAA